MAMFVEVDVKLALSDWDRQKRHMPTGDLYKPTWLNIDSIVALQGTTVFVMNNGPFEIAGKSAEKLNDFLSMGFDAVDVRATL